VRDTRGALVHVRTERGECIGCVEVGLFEIVRQVIEDEAGRGGEGMPAAGHPAPILAQDEGTAR
jgi:hypothetical protein